MELRQLRYFAAVAEDLHFGRAATRLRMTQPALSVQIKNLERELGVTLLLRTKRRVQLSVAGQSFLEAAYVVMHDVERATLAATAVGRGETGDLKVTFSPDSAYDLIPASVQTYLKRYPGVRLIL